MRKYIALMMFLVVFVYGQVDKYQQTLFNEATELKNKLEVLQAPILSPENYKKAVDNYNEAYERFEKGKSLNSINKLLDEFRKYADQAVKISESAKTFFAPTLMIRNNALKVKADEYATDLFKEAEEKFMKAAKEFESGDLNKAQEEAKKAESIYNKAELLSVKNSLLGEARIFLSEAKNLQAEKYANRTYTNAWRSIQQVEELLNSTSYTSSNVQEMAEKATYEAKHAISLTEKIRKLRKDDANWELTFLAFEKILSNIANQLGFEATFEEGFSNAEKNITIAIRNLQDENKELKEELAELRKKNEELENQIEKLQSSQEKVQKKLKEKEELEAKIAKLRELFTRTEALILQEENKVILRLYGLSFASGKSFIAPEYFPLLTKIQKAIRELPVKSIIVEGHTDAIGNDTYNLNLSQMRAEAVKTYLMANMGLDANVIQAIGYGKAKPIAPNDTPENRAKNRRIDIVLVLK
ncbi:MAG: hypothetical protein Kow00108_17610 [Calditrichia bacterium]